MSHSKRMKKISDSILTRCSLTALRVFQRTPRPLAYPIGRSLGWIAFHVWGRVRRIARTNLRAAFPDLSEDKILAIARSTFMNWGVFLMESIRLPRFSQWEWKNRVVIEGREHVENALEHGSGVILFTGHIGCFEMGAACVAHEGVPITAIARYAKTPEMTEQITKIRSAAGYKVLAQDTRGFKAMQRLRANEIVAMLIDQDAHHHGVFVNFFGRPASTPPGPAVLALRTGAALVPGWVIRQTDGKYHMIVESEIQVDSSDPSEENIRRITQEMTTRLETIIRQYPDQWLWMHRRWKTQPAKQVKE